TSADQRPYRRGGRIQSLRRERRKPPHSLCGYEAASSLPQEEACVPSAKRLRVLARVALKNIVLPRALSTLPSPDSKTIALSLMFTSIFLSSRFSSRLTRAGGVRAP